MKNKNRIIALMLVSAMILSFVGCQKNSDGDNGDSTGTTEYEIPESTTTPSGKTQKTGGEDDTAGVLSTELLTGLFTWLFTGISDFRSFLIPPQFPFTQTRSIPH